ncbi:D-alanyl-lipoteichoic acid biosynthesis protein DltD [Limosilactobacillus caecicola]|uniref:D-alanyl-lipoteichoic acid biosynthesis protein DltD n=1 Tax=Limosilactobacillus caecicola TaxID=2941332 RepID=UPI00203E8C28|nr:D-alanyl-lipoteichoic acid biosynthesis protein DltD [Limosilactobacillus caecicola]
MTNKKKLWSIFGPVIVALVLVFIFFCLPWSGHHSAKTEQKAAVSLSPTVFKNRSLKVQALSDRHTKYVPFFGSSEFNRMDRYHPAVMAAKYHSYRPFLFGSRGTQSLPQLFNMTMMSKQMQNKKAVFVISPQWFVKQGVMASAFKYYNGSYANLMWVQQANPKSPYDRYTAKRLLQLLGHDGSVGSYATKISQGKSLSKWDRFVINSKITLLHHEDNLFSGFFIKDNYDTRIKPKIKLLPNQLNYADLSANAVKEHDQASNNNPFGVLNAFYNKRMRGKIKRTADSQRHFNYTQSPEYGDLEVVLKQFQRTNTNVIFMITPVNAKWEKHTGMPMKMYYQTVRKIKTQLRAQGFNNIIDYSHKGSENGFMQDTIHIGWAGWVDFDRQTAPFLEKKQPQPNYKMNDAFLSKDWLNLKPTQKNLQQFKSEHHIK